MRHKGRQEYSVLSINGRLRLRRVRWHCQQQGSTCPSDRWLDEAEATISRGVREMACRLNQDSTSFARTATNLAHTAHIELSKETLREVVHTEAQAVQRQLQRGELLPGWSATDCATEQGPTRVYLGCDGVKVPLVTEQEKQKRRTGIRQKRSRSGRKCRSLSRRKSGADQPYKEFRIAILHDESQQHRYVSATSGNHEAAGRMMRRMAAQVDFFQADQRVANIDGAPWIRNQIEFHGLVERGNIGLDYYHLKENVQKARHVVFGPQAAEDEQSDGQGWVNEIMHAFYEQRYDAVWEKLVAWRAALRGAKRQAADRLIQYVAERRDMIRYPQFRAQGWQIGSGPTEAQCKTTTHRLKGRGRRWDPDNAEGLMALAALDASGMWQQHWTNLDPQRN